MPARPLLERYRAPIVVIVAVAAVALMAVWAFNSSSAAAYSCSVEFQAPAGSPSPDGYVQESMGNSHVSPGTEVTYTYCPPASGSHINVQGRGPLPARVYGPGDAAPPQGWVHNLEHGGLVLLYRGLEGDPGPTPETQQAIRDFAASAPNSPVCGLPANQYLLATRFDQMATPFAALVWGRVLPLDSFDTNAIQTFWNEVGEQAATMPERFGCPLPSASPPAAPSAAPSSS
jgi:hypothetical protein